MQPQQQQQQLPIGFTSSSKSASSKDKPKPCCACPDTKRARDECFLLKGSEEDCKELIDAHRKCMMQYGYTV